MNADGLAALRAEYADAGLDESAAGDDPIALFARWLGEAVASGLHEPNAMALATAGRSGAPTVRFVLLKGFDTDGFCFYTNYRSRKSRELEAEPRCGLVFAWHPMGRQVRIDGAAARMSVAESDAHAVRIETTKAIARGWCMPGPSATAGPRPIMPSHGVEQRAIELAPETTT